MVGSGRLGRDAVEAGWTVGWISLLGRAEATRTRGSAHLHLGQVAACGSAAVDQHAYQLRRYLPMRTAAPARARTVVQLSAIQRGCPRRRLSDRWSVQSDASVAGFWSNPARRTATATHTDASWTVFRCNATPLCSVAASAWLARLPPQSWPKATPPLDRLSVHNRCNAAPLCSVATSTASLAPISLRHVPRRRLL